jgi:integrase
MTLVSELSWKLISPVLLLWNPVDEALHFDWNFIAQNVRTRSSLIVQPPANRKPKSDLKHIRDHYTTDTYHPAVTHGIAQQATPRIDPPYRVAKFRAAGLVYWTPHQLRHAKAQMIRDQFGLEAAQAVLGHSSLTATQIYAKKRLDLAKELAAKCG